jgi:GDPmannose 4,6-dehydratase
MRAGEVSHLQGVASMAKEILGWEPKISFKQLVQRMVDYDIQRSSRHKRTITMGPDG